MFGGGQTKRVADDWLLDNLFSKLVGDLTVDEIIFCTEGVWSNYEKIRPEEVVEIDIIKSASAL